MRRGSFHPPSHKSPFHTDPYNSNNNNNNGNHDDNYPHHHQISHRHRRPTTTTGSIGSIVTRSSTSSLSLSVGTPVPPFVVSSSSLCLLAPSRALRVPIPVEHQFDDHDVDDDDDEKDRRMVEPKDSTPTTTLHLPTSRQEMNIDLHRMTSAETMLVSNLPQDTNHENVTNRIQMEEEEEADESNSGGHVVSMNHHDNNNNNNNNNNNHMELVPFAATVMGSELQAVGLLSPPTMTDTTIAPIPTNRYSQEPSVFAMDAVTISSMEDNSTVQSYMSSSDRSMFTFNSTLRSHQNDRHPYPYTDEAPRPPSPIPQGREFFQEPYRIKRKFTPTESSTQRSPTEEEEEQQQQQHHVVSLLPPPATATLLEASMGEATVVVIPHAKTEMSIVPSSRMVKDDISGLSSMSSMVVATPLTTRPETNRLELSSSSISPPTDRDDERIDPMPPFPWKLLPPPPPEQQHHYRRVSSPTQPDHHSSLGPFPTTTIHEHMATLLHHATSPPPPPPQQPPQQQQMSSVLTPRAQLHLLYGQPPRRKVISNSHYHCWPDSNPTHIQQWTAVLVCPMTGELFLAGPCPLFHVTRITLTDPIFNGPGNLHHATTTMFWFTKKSFAEHGAAARAYDCLTFRDRMANAASSSVDRVVGPIGIDPPYLEPIYRIPDLMVIPYEIRQNIIRQQAEIRRVGGLPPV